MMTPIFSPFPAVPIEPNGAEEISFNVLGRVIPREGYPPLSWTVEELVGSQWCNLHTGEIQIIDRIEKYGRQENPLPCFPRTYSYYDSREGPGFWLVDQYIVEHWIRIDHWPLAGQLASFGFELRFHKKMIERQRAQIKNIDANPTIWLGSAALQKRDHRRDIHWHEQKLHQVIERAQQFATMHSLEIPANLRGFGVN